MARLPRPLTRAGPVQQADAISKAGAGWAIPGPRTYVVQYVKPKKAKRASTLIALTR